jgi:hypothetical protein
MNPNPRQAGGPGPGGAAILGTVSLQAPATDRDRDRESDGADAPRAGSPELFRALAEVKGQAQFLLYLADQIEDSLHQLADETEAGHSAFLCKLLGMYSAQLESKHQGLGDKIAETCQEVYVTVREYDLI